MASVLTDENEVMKLQSDLNHALVELNKSRSKLKALEVSCVACIAVVFIVSLALFAALGQAKQNTFAFYYANDVRQRYGVDDLESYLNRWQWIEGAYVANKFDCIKRRLKNEGYHAIIVAGKCPWDSTQRHAWLLVETSEDKYMPVEATQYRLVKWGNPYFGAYFEYDHSFETIYDALEYNYNEYKWWES